MQFTQGGVVSSSSGSSTSRRSSCQWGHRKTMWERSSGSSLHLTQSSPTEKALMPNPSKSGVESAAKAVLRSVSAALQLSKGLSAEAGYSK
eukprot:6301313-Amphidinium_carterae.1